MKLTAACKLLLINGAMALPLAVLHPSGALAAPSLPLAQEGIKQPGSAPDVQSGTCCPKPTGCVRTQGYWGNKPALAWPAPYARDTTFFRSTLTWQDILDTPPAGGNGYLILAHQYIAAVLNRAAGASVPAAVQTVIDQATAYFNSGAQIADCGGASCQTQKEWARILDSYNNGTYSGAPAACPD
ncbi:hypothetical protein KY495_19770 [Massilia sp. PAMC28688]|uniref:hypothetical protein n=1 Tax=Massilia sp. PAMC28688 TaxID=2861283 RepID=UPI001C63AEDE|nr:hypothetical protein [Massilia sp. PAMC28688]QYF92926.1 hypothetical protein KY495_19770 [Massilia sp. PAMC28688]